MNGFHEVVFPEDVSWGSQGGPMFKTHVFPTFRGLERRNIEWAQPIMRFNVAYGLRTDVNMMRVIDFFNARQGAATGFRYKNWVNYEVVNAPIATGDGVSRRLPLYKFYGFQGARFYKRLRKIERGSVVSVQANNEPLVEGIDFSIDYDAGEIALVDDLQYGSPVYAQRLGFHEPVRFDTDSIQSVIEAYNTQSLEQFSLIGIRADFRAGSVFAPGENDANDPLYDNSPLILNFDDLNDLTTTIDQSALATPIVLAGTARIATDSFRHGGGSLSLGATGTCALSPSGFTPGNAPWTVEGFFSPPQEGALIQPMLAHWSSTTSATGWILRYNFERKRLEYLVGNGTDPDVTLLSYPWRGQAGRFDHISASRTEANWYVMRINGEVVQTFKSDLKPLSPESIRITIGSFDVVGGGGQSYRGNIDSVRFTYGITRTPGFERGTIPSPYTAS